MPATIGSFFPQSISAADLQKEFSARLSSLEKVEGGNVSFTKKDDPNCTVKPTGKVSDQDGREIFIEYEIPKGAPNGAYNVTITINANTIESTETIEVVGQTGSSKRKTPKKEKTAKKAADPKSAKAPPS